MPLSPGLCSYLVPESACARMASVDEFWSTLHDAGRLVDQSPGYTAEMLDLLLDFLAVDYLVRMPRGLAEQYAISDPPGTRLIGVFTHHDLRTLHTQIGKVTGSGLPASSVIDAYGKSFTPIPLDQDWLGYLSRQCNHLKTDGSVLIVICHASAIDAET